jgi:hypothetical protein
MQLLVSVRQTLDRSIDRKRIVLDVPKKPDFPSPATSRNRDGALPLCGIESDEDSAMLSHDLPSAHEA